MRPRFLSRIPFDISVYANTLLRIVLVGMGITGLFLLTLVPRPEPAVNPYVKVTDEESVSEIVQARHINQPEPYIEPIPLTEEEFAKHQQQLREESIWDAITDPDSGEGQGIVGALPGREEWIAEFNKTKRSMIRNGYPLCQGCGRSPEDCGKITHDMHHVISVKRIVEEKLNPSLKWDSRNMIILCRPNVASRLDDNDKGCHFTFGHLGQSWDVSNPNVREDAAKNFKKLHGRVSYDQLVEAYYENQPVSVPQRVHDHKRSKMPAKTEVSP